MYGIYKSECYNSQPKLIAICYTSIGAKRSCRHFMHVYSKETGNVLFRVEYRPLDSYWKLRIGYAMLRVVRRMETRKLRRLEDEERQASHLRAEQEKRLASLY